MTWTLQDIENGRDLVMEMDPTRSGSLTIRQHDGWAPLAKLPKPGAIDYLAEVTLEDRDVVFRFDIPEGAPRAFRRVQYDGFARRVRVGSEDDLEAQSQGL